MDPVRAKIESVAAKLETLTILSEAGDECASWALRDVVRSVESSEMFGPMWIIIREKSRQLLEKYNVEITDQLVERHARWIVYRDTTGY